jgi:hypothetical protein
MGGEILTAEEAGIEVVWQYEGAGADSELDNLRSNPSTGRPLAYTPAEGTIASTDASSHSEIPDRRQTRDPKDSEDWIYKQLDEFYGKMKRRATSGEVAEEWNAKFPKDKRNGNSIINQILRSTRLSNIWKEQAKPKS